MPEEIKYILDEAATFEELHTKIMKVIMFIDTLPYPGRKKSRGLR